MAATILRHNLTTVVTALCHSLAIAKALSVKYPGFSLLFYNHSLIKHLTSCFSFFALTQKGAEKRKTTAEPTHALTAPASYRDPSQRIRQRCIAMRLARATIAFLPLPVLCKSRLYI